MWTVENCENVMEPVEILLCSVIWDTRLVVSVQWICLLSARSFFSFTNCAQWFYPLVLRRRLWIGFANWNLILVRHFFHEIYFSFCEIYLYNLQKFCWQVYDTIFFSNDRIFLLYVISIKIIWYLFLTFSVVLMPSWLIVVCRSYVELNEAPNVNSGSFPLTVVYVFHYALGKSSFNQECLWWKPYNTNLAHVS